MPQYKVYDSYQKVSSRYKKSNRHAIEKYLPERRGQSYALRQTAFFGDCNRSVETSSDEHILKRNRDLQRRLFETPKEVMKYREKTGFDYGKLDYFFHDNQFFLFDKNKKIGGSNVYTFPGMVVAIAPGIEYFIDRI